LASALSYEKLLVRLAFVNPLFYLQIYNSLMSDTRKEESLMGSILRPIHIVSS